MDKRNNLIPGAHQLTVEEQSKGGLKSGESRREKRELRKALETLLESEYEGESGEVTTGCFLIATKLFERAMNGNVKAFEVIRDTVGQRPIEKTQQLQTDIVIDLGEGIGDER